MNKALSRRTLLRALLGTSLAAPASQLFSRSAFAAGGVARRLIVFYFPDGVPADSQSGQKSLWHATGTETSFVLPALHSALEPFKEQCVFFNNLSTGPRDSGSHPGGAKKLLTAWDDGQGESLDRMLGRTFANQAPFASLNLGVMANQNASADKHISYVSAGASAAPEDDPLVAFGRLFPNGQAVPVSSPSQPSSPAAPADPLAASVIDNVLADLNELRARLGSVEQTTLDLHLEAVRDVERRIKGLPGTVDPSVPPLVGDCSTPTLTSDSSRLYDPAYYPELLRAQSDLMVNAMACGSSRVGVIQNSGHTSDLLMNLFPGTEMYSPSFNLSSHTASHYGASHDPTQATFTAFEQQVRWWVQQFAYVLEQLKSRPEGDGNMLDYSLVLMCSEVSDGNTHGHDNMPFILAGGGGGAVRTGRLLDNGYRRHGELLAGISAAMGGPSTFGEQSWAALPGLLA